MLEEIKSGSGRHMLSEGRGGGSETWGGKGIHEVSKMV